MSPKPKLGQNFLIDDAACLQIASALGDLSSRTVVEIGPGHGAITILLAPRCRRLHCIEYDPALARELAFRFRNDAQVSVHQADILRTDLGALLAQEARETTLESLAQEGLAPEGLAPEGPVPGSSTPQPPAVLATSLDVVGNLPYYITSDILFTLFAAARAGVVSRAVLMMQREVADRLLAEPGSRDYGALAAAARMHAQVTALFTLPPGAFAPPPAVFSTVLRLSFAPRFADLGVDPHGFNRLLRASFAQKRKTLANNLRAAGYSPAQLTAAWPDGLAAQARAETVSLELMAELYIRLGSTSVDVPEANGGRSDPNPKPAS